ncbi:hypothetical protein T439DRAFT_309597 [Meredithblackwellia eburnea MCA 4105]
MSSESVGLTQLLANIRSTIPKPTQAAADLPDAQDLAFERTLSRPLARKLDNEGERILGLVTDLIKWLDPDANSKWQADGDLIKDGVYRDVVEKVEGLLEAADDDIEKHLGTGKAKKPVGALGAKLDGTSNNGKGKNGASKSGQPGKDRLAPHLLHDPNLAKPQLSFPPRLVVPIPPFPSAASVKGITDLADPALAEFLWKPVLRRKPHANSNPDSWLVTEVYNPASKSSPHPSSVFSSAYVPPADPPASRLRYAHPYKSELSTLKAPSHFFKLPTRPAKPEPNSFEQVPFEWIGDMIGFEKMIKEIRAVGDDGHRELAVDLEHHDFRSYIGLTCLIQLSTRKKDYVIDPLDPSVRDNLEQLNEFFADPDWIKVFHGANSDIIWLQRDFGIYVVGLFDTYHATMVLKHERHGLANLLEKYANFEADKRYQLADWRIRPLPKEMLHYARSDTHYLLDIYDHVRLDLSQTPAPKPPKPASDDPFGDIMDEPEGEEHVEIDPRACLELVFNKSIETSSNVYEQLPYDGATGLSEGGWRIQLSKWHHVNEYDSAVALPSLPIKTGWGPGEVKLELLRALHAWREKVARDEDESPRFVMGNDALERLLDAVPRSEEEVVKNSGGGKGNVGELVRKRKAEIVMAVEGALDNVTVGPEQWKAVAREDVRNRKAASIGVEVGLGVEEPAVAPVGGLWDAKVALSVSPAPTIRTSTSTFFGATAALMSSVAAVVGLAAVPSSFFGPSSTTTNTGAPKRETKNEAVARVHASLVLGGGLANSLRAHVVPVAVSTTQTATVEVSTEVPTAETMDMDHSFVPLTDRLPKPSTSLVASSSLAKPSPAMPHDSDVLIVSSLADKPKKRRRAKVEDSAGDADGIAVSSPVVGGDEREGGEIHSPEKKKKKQDKKAKREEMERLAPHDYSKSRSILDAVPVTERDQERDTTGGNKKQKKNKDKVEPGKKKGFEVDTSAFGRAPRARTEDKRGNVSRSFA